MTENERKQTALKIYTDLQNLMLALYDRWRDESEYENINDYAINLKKKVEENGGKFLKMSKRPFGFTYVLADATYQMKIGGKSLENLYRYEYHRIA